MSLSSLSALDGVKQEVQLNNISLDMIYCIRIVCWHKIWNHHLTAFGLRVDVVSDRSSRSGAKNAGSLGRVATRPKLSSFFHSSDTIALRLVLLTESLNIPFEYQFGILVTLSPPPLPWEKRTQERVKSWPISWSTFCQTGLERVLKTLKVLQFYFDIFQNQKVLEEKDYRPWKNRSEPGKFLENFSEKGYEPC